MNINRNETGSKSISGRTIVSLLTMGAACYVADGVTIALAASGTKPASCVSGECETRSHTTKINNGSVSSSTSGEHSNRETGIDEATIPFVISVDGEVIDESGKTIARTFGSSSSADPIDRQKKTDVDLDAVDIQIKYDGLDQRTLLNIATTPLRRMYQAGETVEFLTTANYPAFIRRAEVRILDLAMPQGANPFDILRVDVNGPAYWTMPTGGSGDFGYVLRVYDASGRFDETEMLTLGRSARPAAPGDRSAAVAPGMAEDRTAVRNIPVLGGAVTVFGRNVPPGFGIVALGDGIPVDATGSFVVQRILPPGDHQIKVAVSGAAKGGGLNFNREVTIPRDEWFYVMLADLTAKKRFGDNGVEDVRAGEYDRVQVEGGLSFYLKGKIKGTYLLTAAADLQDGEWEDILRNATEQDPGKLLRRIDPDRYYPVYGDGSVAMNDAPTDGKLFVRLEKGDSHVMWGNYRTEITGTEFMRSQRALYGASAVHRSQAVTPSGDHRTEARAFAAQPGTLSQQDEFLATGGTAYFLKRQDITVGSATVSIEVRDAVTNSVLERRMLDEDRDYSINHLQGLVTLTKPLSPVATSTEPVRDGTFGKGNVFLVVHYEYTPTSTDVDGYSYGARLQHWLSDKLRLGITGSNDKTNGSVRDAYGADFTYRVSPSTYVEGEIAQSDGSSFRSFRSTDGGLTFSDVDGSDPDGKQGQAWRLSGQVDLEDLDLGGLRGMLWGGYEERKAGFSTLYDEAAIDRRVWESHAKLDLTDSVGVGAGYRELRDGAGQVRQDGDASASWQVNDQLKMAVGLSHTSIFSPAAIAAGKSGYDGARLDSGIRVEYGVNDDLRIYGFGQATVARSGDIDRNDRAGVGGQYQITEKISVLGEVSHGTHGVGGAATVHYDPTASDGYYVGYRLDPDRAYALDNSYTLEGTDAGTVVTGTRRKLSETTTAFSESNFDMFGRRRSLSQTYGVNYTPDAQWDIDTSFHTGLVRDDTVDPESGVQRADFDRKAASMAVRYRDESTGLEGRVRGEARFEDSEDDSRDATSYLFSGGLGWSMNPDWRAQADLKGVHTASDNESLAGDYLEASLGYALRPVDNDRLNALFKYTYLYDNPGSGQISAVTGLEDGPRQRSHILSADFIYELYPWLSAGAKYGLRHGEVDFGDTEDGWTNSTAHLAIARADLHVIHNWDALLEARMLLSPEADAVDFGAFVAVYRHLGDNFKLGAGYNFGSFSDDLRDVTLDDQGFMFNLIGKY